MKYALEAIGMQYLFAGNYSIGDTIQQVRSHTIFATYVEVPKIFQIDYITVVNQKKEASTKINTDSALGVEGITNVFFAGEVLEIANLKPLCTYKYIPAFVNDLVKIEAFYHPESVGEPSDLLIITKNDIEWIQHKSE